jgi:hypothetical protein
MSFHLIIKFAQIKFPSDQLTIGELRRLFPRSFDESTWKQGEYTDTVNSRPYGRQGLEGDLGMLIDYERVLASVAFKQAVGESETTLLPLERRLSFKELTERLANFYVEIGLSSGMQHARQLVREITKQAKSQAQNHLSTRPR